jgi:hypothetical protein
MYNRLRWIVIVPTSICSETNLLCTTAFEDHTGVIAYMLFTPMGVVLMNIDLVLSSYGTT